MADTKKDALLALLEALVETDPQRELLAAFKDALTPPAPPPEVKKAPR